MPLIHVTSAELRGFTVDVSETGLRARLVTETDNSIVLSGMGAIISAVAPAQRLELRGTVVRAVLQENRGEPFWAVALRFDNLRERQGDYIRSEVFKALRELQSLNRD